MRIVNYNTSDNSSTTLQKHKISYDPKYREIELKFKLNENVYYVKFTLGDIFEMLRTMFRGF